MYLYYWASIFPSTPSQTLVKLMQSSSLSIFPSTCFASLYTLHPLIPNWKVLRLRVLTVSILISFIRTMNGAQWNRLQLLNYIGESQRFCFNSSTTVFYIHVLGEDRCMDISTDMTVWIRRLLPKLGILGSILLHGTLSRFSFTELSWLKALRVGLTDRNCKKPIMYGSM